MTDTFNLNVLALNQGGGRDLPGVHAAMPPRRAARGRKNEGFIAYLHVESGPPLSREQHQTLLTSLEKTFYGTPGSATAALRALAEGLNDALMNRNLRAGGEPTLVYLTLMAARDDMLYLAQSGPAHGFLITRQNIEHVYDPHTSGRGLGVARTLPLRYYQTRLTDGALLLVTPRLPAGWNSATFKDSAGRPLAHAAQRFVGDAQGDIQAILLEARHGPGRVSLLRAPTSSQPPDSPLRPAARPKAQPALPAEAERTPAPRPAGERASQPRRPAPPPASASTAAPAPAVVPSAAPAREPKPARAHTAFGPSALKAGRSLGALARRAGGGLRRGLARILPGEDLLTLPASTMAVIAVAVPVVVTTIALVVYLNRGRAEGFQAYFSQAQASADAAETAQDPESAAAAWRSALFYLDRAEAYLQDPAAADLRARAQSSLDELEGVFRLTFSPAVVGSLNPGIRIRQMAATGTDLYMLDISSGSVLRAWLTGTGYVFDPDFSCGPAQYGSYIVGPLVDLAVLPRNSLDAPIVAMDANGNLLYCIPGEAPLAAPLVPPDSAWGNPLAMAVDGDDLYILDPLTNAVWLYRGEDAQFREAPRFFFSAEVPRLDTAIDLAVNGDDLYLLHSDGHYTLCVFSALVESPTRCEDPAIYTDGRPGRASGPQIEGATFYLMQRTEPPEPSLFFLDPITRSIYHFSLRVNLVRQYRVQSDFPAGLATAFAISPTRAVFLALDDRVYVSYLP
jgi:hypothetical protein